MTPDYLRWILTPVFALAGALALVLGFWRTSAAQRVSGVLHVAVCAGMIAMIWPVTMSRTQVPQIVAYGAAAAWFAGLLVFDAHARHDKTALAYHAAMAAAAAWMALARPAVPFEMSAPMSVRGGHAGMSTTGGAEMTMDAPSHVAVIASVWTVVFAVAGVCRLVRAIGAVRGAGGLGRPAIEAFADAAMGLGMAVTTGFLI
ncbi:MAG: hypothetical protein QOI78_2479 [Actinomycetota bacterium]|jgi:hypothetical protein|nr:hypothetical protein [Actinomycetota bacterium]